MLWCLNPDCPHKARTGKPAEYRDGIARCHDCGGGLSSAGGEIAREPAGPWRRLGVSAGFVALIILLVPVVPLPLVEFPRGWAAPGLLDLFQWMAPALGAFGLGVMPFIYGFALWELVALVVPGWRSRRHGDPAARAQIEKGAVAVSLLVAVGQAYVNTHWLVSVDALPAEALAAALVMLSFVAGSVALFFLTRLQSQFGLGNGFSLLALLVVIDEVRELAALWPRAESGAIAPMHVVLAWGSVAVLVGATSFVLRAHLRPHGKGGARLGSPASGLDPLITSGAVMVWATMLVPGLLDAPASTAWWGRLGLTVPLCFVFTALYNRPSRLVAVQTATGSPLERSVAARDMWAAAARAVLFFGLLLVAERLVQALSGGLYSPDTIALVVATAVLLDLAREWRAHAGRDLVPVWEIHQVYAVDPALAALAGAGIDAHARSAFHRTLLQFFGPLVPVAVLVPRAQVDAALAVLRAGLSSGPRSS